MDCFGPIGGALAFLGAVAILGSLYSVLVTCIIMQTRVEGIRDEEDIRKATLWMVIAGCCAILLILVTIGGIINQHFVPASCH